MIFRRSWLGLVIFRDISAGTCVIFRAVLVGTCDFSRGLAPDLVKIFLENFGILETNIF